MSTVINQTYKIGQTKAQTNGQTEVQIGRYAIQHRNRTDSKNGAYSVLIVADKLSYLKSSLMS